MMKEGLDFGKGLKMRKNRGEKRRSVSTINVQELGEGN
jgi:hypothetical protein